MVAFTASVLVGILVLVVPYVIAKRRRPEPAPLTWGEAMVAALWAFFVSFWWYGIIPHQWLTFADNELLWRGRQGLVRARRHHRPAAVRRQLPGPAGHHRRRHLRGRPRAASSCCGRSGRTGPRPSRPPTSPAPTTGVPSSRPRPAERREILMARTDANPPMPEFRDDYVLYEVDASWLSAAVKPKQFIHIDQSECIMCEGCVDICPWKCIHMVTPDAVDDAYDVERPGIDPSDHVHLHDRRRRLHPLRALRRPLPHRRDHPGQARRTGGRRATSTSGRTPMATPTACASAERSPASVGVARLGSPDAHRPT